MLDFTDKKLQNYVIVFAGVFPEPDKDSVIQIANMVIRQGDAEPFIKNVFTLDTCAPVIGSQVLSYMSEKELLDVSSLTRDHTE